MAKAEVTVHVAGIPEIAAVLAAAQEVRDELRVRGDHGVSVDTEQRLIEALDGMGVWRKLNAMSG